MLATCLITEASYRYIETPIRKGTLFSSLARIRRSPVAGPRNALFVAGAVLASLTLFAGISLATAPVEENEVRQALDEGAEATCDVVNDPSCSSAEATDPVVPDETTAPEGTTDATGSAVPPPTDLTTTTTAPPAPIEQLAIGDSVMLGAAPELSDNGFIVDAAESRQFSNGADTVATLNTQGRLGSVVVVHLGTNGTINDSDMTRMMEALAGVPQVLMLTLDVDRDWIPGNNALIYDTVNSYANVSLLDWAGLAGSCPGDCFASDGFHLRPDGQVYYAALIEGALQAPT
jgi:hypothetical protein